ncbi:O-methyltransferase [bacterium]|nr:MAG: O-methyltransferase [bacterium]
MSKSQWEAVDAYLTGQTHENDPVLQRALARNAEAGLPAIDVSPALGKLLNLLVRTSGAKSILEVGTLGGYSTTWLARGLPDDGRIVTLELEPKHAEVARQNVDDAGVGAKVQIVTGRAADNLPSIEGPFDFIFIDADKPSNPVYWNHALRLSRPGTLIVVDNVVRHGAVIDDASTDPNIAGVRTLLELISAEPRVDATAIQTVGLKGYDGFLIALIKD